MVNGHDFGFVSKNSVFGILIFCLVMITLSLFIGGNTVALATDETATVMEAPASGYMPPLKKLNPAVIWEGAVTIDAVENDYFLQCAGIDARILLAEEETSEYPATRFYGFGGEPISLEELMEMDLSTVHADMRLAEDQTYVVRWLVLGPALTLKGRVTEIDPELETITVQGFTVAITENTRLHKLRIFHPCPPIAFSDLALDTRVRTVAHYDEETETYWGLSVMAALPPRANAQDGIVE